MNPEQGLRPGLKALHLARRCATPRWICRGMSEPAPTSAPGAWHCSGMAMRKLVDSMIERSSLWDAFNDYH